MSKFNSVLLVMAIIAGCGSMGPQPAATQPEQDVYRPDRTAFKVVRSSQGDLLGWSKNESFLLLQSKDFQSQRAVLAELREKSMDCPYPPCGEPLRAAALEEINDTLAGQIEERLMLGSNAIWVSRAGNTTLIRGQGQDWLLESLAEPDPLLRLVPCAAPVNGPQADCVRPLPPPSASTRVFDPLE